MTPPRNPSNNLLLPSMLDRLIDPDPKKRAIEQVPAAQSLRALKDSVRRNLEWLLNSRRTPEEPPAGAKELPRSVYWYGLPDITSFALATEESRYELAHRIRIAVALFEPRLRNINVTVIPSTHGSRVLQFQIEALLRTEPAPSRVYFDTTLEMTRGEYQIAGDSHAR